MDEEYLKKVIRVQAVARGWLTRHILQADYVIDELINTERSYHNSLEGKYNKLYIKLSNYI